MIKIEDLIKEMTSSQFDIVTRMRDNVFSANHRCAMISQYGYTEAMRVQVQFDRGTERAVLYE